MPCPRWISPSGSPGLAIRPSNLTPDSVAPDADTRRGPRLPNEADAALARQIQAGDERAFATFYDRLAPGLFSMIYAILHDQKESEDVLQEAFVQMWKRSATYDATRSSLFTWAVMISRHKAIDRLRSRQRRNRLVEGVAGEPGAPREAVALAFFTGLTQTQIAEKLGASPGTVKAQIRRGLLALREAPGGLST